MPFSSEAQGSAAHASKHESGGNDPVNVSGEGHISIAPFGYSAIIQGTWAYVGATSNWNNGAMGNLSGVAINDEIHYSIYLAAGTYTFFLLSAKGSTHGSVNVMIDSSNEGDFDLYFAGSSYENLNKITGIVFATGGLKTLKLKVDSKNASSSNYYLYIQELGFFRTA